MITSTLVLYVKRLSKNNQQNHIQYDHQELYYDNIKKCYKNFKTKTKIRNHKKRNITKKLYKKITDESGSLNYKSRDKNNSGESFGVLK